MAGVTIKSQREIELMREAGKLLAEVHNRLAEEVVPGISSLDLDRLGEELIRKSGSIPSFLNYEGYPASVCVSINDEVVHGIPKKDRIIKDGDIVSLDIGLIHNGYQSDAARTHAVGNVSKEAMDLIEVTRQSFFEGIKFAHRGCRVSDISHAIQTYVEHNGFSLVRDYVGHGVGSKLHESPEVPNFGPPGHGPRLLPGMTIAVEPMVNQGGPAIRVMRDGWTVRTADGSLAAHYENSLLITRGDPEILTTVGDLKI